MQYHYAYLVSLAKPPWGAALQLTLIDGQRGESRDERCGRCTRSAEDMARHTDTDV